MSRTRLLAATLCVLLLIPATAMAGPKEGSNGDRSTDQETTIPCDGGTVTFEGPQELWPPNHKDFPAALTFTPDTEDEYAYEATAGHDQVVENGTEANGSGNTPLESDFAFVNEDGSTTQMIAGTGNGPLTFPMTVRAERAGTDQSGRLYTVSGIVTYSGGMPCDFAFNVYVPHDQGNRNNSDRPGALLYMGL